MNTTLRNGSVALATALALAACGGGGGGLVSNGGIGGTGIGVITGFGSVHLNQDSVFQTDDSTVFELDGDSISRNAFEIASNRGLTVRIEIEGNDDDDFNNGTATRVEAGNEIKGAVTSVDPLTVLGQPVVTTGSTFLENLTSVSTLVLGDEVEVAGHRDTNGAVLATRIERKAAGIQVWKLTGKASGADATGFSIGGQRVDFITAGTEINDCPGNSVGNGQLVEAKFTRPATYSAGDTLFASKVECRVAGLPVPGNLPAGTTTLVAEIEGIVTSLGTFDPLTGSGTFEVNGQPVALVASGLDIEGGTLDDLVLGARVEVEGRFNVTTRLLTADELEFRETRVRIEAPVSAGDVDTGARTLTILGITVQGSALTEDDDGLLGGALTGSRQVEVRGFRDSNGTVFATRVDDKGTADPGDVELRGPATPGADQLYFQVLGVSVDTIADPSVRFEIDDVPVDRSTFFGALTGGARVQVSGAIDLTPEGSHTTGFEIDADEVEIDD